MQYGYPRRLAVMYSTLKNLRTVDELRTRLAKRGYVDDKITEGDTLAEASRRAAGLRFDARGEAIEATGEQTDALDAIRAALNVLDPPLGRAFRDDPETMNALGLVGRRPESIVGLIEHARNLAAGLAKPERWAQATAKGVIQGDLDALLAAVAAADTEREEQDTGDATAQVSTAQRKAAFVRSDEWMLDLQAAGRAEFPDEPQMLEYLGIIVRA